MSFETSDLDSSTENRNTNLSKDQLLIQSDSKQTQQHTDNIIVKTKKYMQQNWDQSRRSMIQARMKIIQMIPQSVKSLVYWRNPILSGAVFGISLSAIITFMFLSSLAAITFWLLTLLIVVGLYKLYNYVMATFVGTVREDIFDSMLPSDISISEQRARDLSDQIRVHGTFVLKHAKSLFLWENFTNSILFGLTLFAIFYVGLSMNALTLAFVSLIFLFTIPKIYEVYQVPIDRTAKQVFDQINQLFIKFTSKLPNKAKKL